jgi:hypothetical protein
LVLLPRPPHMSMSTPGSASPGATRHERTASLLEPDACTYRSQEEGRNDRWWALSGKINGKEGKTVYDTQGSRLATVVMSSHIRHNRSRKWDWG